LVLIGMSSTGRNLDDQRVSVTRLLHLCQVSDIVAQLGCNIFNTTERVLVETKHIFPPTMTITKQSLYTACKNSTIKSLMTLIGQQSNNHHQHSGTFAMTRTMIRVTPVF